MHGFVTDDGSVVTVVEHPNGTQDGYDISTAMKASRPCWYQQHRHDPANNTHRRRRTYDRWHETSACYPDDHLRHTFTLGVAVAPGFQGSHYIPEWLAITNMIFGIQMNVVFKALPTTPTSIAPCGNIKDVLKNFNDWEKPYDAAVWIMFADCPDSEWAGMAYVDALCTSYNTGLVFTSYNPPLTWLTLAHELGHTVGAGHTFEEGKGTTGGIMDYGLHWYNSKQQFNTKYRQAEVCAALTATLTTNKCNNLRTKTDEPPVQPWTNPPPSTGGSGGTADSASTGVIGGVVGGVAVLLVVILFAFNKKHTPVPYTRLSTFK